MEYHTKQVQDKNELEKAIEFDKKVLKAFNNESTAYTKEAWLENLANNPELLIYAENEGNVIGLAFGWVENECITISIVEVDVNYRNQGIASMLLGTLESNAIKKGYHSFSLGGRRHAEGFYIKQGYTSSLFIQSKHPRTLDELRSINKIYKEAWCYDDGIDIRLSLLTKVIDRELQDSYDKTFPECNTITLFNKTR